MVFLLASWMKASGRGFKKIERLKVPSGPHNHKMEEKQIIIKHVLVPEHVKLSEEQKQELLKKYNISVKQLPRIKSDDPALKMIEVRTGDVIMIKRKSPTIGESYYYRVVVNG